MTRPAQTPMERYADLEPLIAWNEARWSGRGQRFVEEAPRYFERARFTAMPKQGGGR